MSKPANPDLWRREAREGINQDRVRLLVEAARSGDYTQGTNYLCKVTYLMDADGPVADAPRKCFCILGLAIQVAQDNGLDCIAHVDIKYSSTGDIVRSYWCKTPDDDNWLKREQVDMDLPPCVQEWYGFDCELPSVLLPNGEVNELAELNDHGRSFEALADFIAYTYLDSIPELSSEGDDADTSADS